MWLKSLLSFAAGLIYAFNFPSKYFVSFVIMPIFAIALLLWNITSDNEDRERTSLRFKLSQAFLFCLAASLLGYYWIPYTLREFGGMQAPFNYLVGMILGPLTLPQFYTSVFLVHLLEKTKFTNPILKYSRVTIYAFVFTISEIITPQQFPTKAGNGFLVLQPYLGLAPIFGASIFSFFLYYIASSINGFLKKYPFNYPVILFSIGFVIFNASMPLEYEKTSETLNTRIVQANIGSLMKVQSEGGDFSAVETVLATYYDLSKSPVPNEWDQVELIVWPETALPGLLSSRNIKNGRPFPPIITDITRTMNTEMFFGGYDYNHEKDENSEVYFEDQFNTIFHANASGILQGLYHKKELIPFGETMPFGPFNKYLKHINSNISFFARGKESPLLTTRDNFKFMPVICYEILFSEFVQDFINEHKENRPDFIINLTNDSWYGDTSEPHQHLFLSHWRALEFNIPILRSTNTGITSILYPDGSESERMGVGEKRVLDIQLYKSNGKATFYQAWGDWSVVVLMLGFIAISYLINVFFRNDGLEEDEVSYKNI